MPVGIWKDCGGGVAGYPNHMKKPSGMFSLQTVFLLCPKNRAVIYLSDPAVPAGPNGRHLSGRSSPGNRWWPAWPMHPDSPESDKDTSLSPATNQVGTSMVLPAKQHGLTGIQTIAAIAIPFRPPENRSVQIPARQTFSSCSGHPGAGTNFLLGRHVGGPHGRACPIPFHDIICRHFSRFLRSPAGGS